MIKYLRYKKYYKAIKESGLFDVKYYLFTYPDIRKIGVDPIKHYLKFGAYEGRNPSAEFDTNFYLNTYSDVKELGVNPLAHYILYGKKEFRVPKKLLDAAGYTYKIPKFTNDIRQAINNFTIKPLISVIMPVYNVNPRWLKLAIRSIKNQWYENCDLFIVDDKSTNQRTLQYLKIIKNNKIKIKLLKKNVNIAGSSNDALKMTNGEYIVLMDNDDEITPDAFYEIVKVINEKKAEFIYSDEDKLEMNGSYSNPHFKPDFAPDMFLSQNYISHLGVIKKSLIDKVRGFEIGLEGSQDYDLYLKVLEYTDKMHHIQKVLYHWRRIPGSTATEFSGKSYAQEAGRKALKNAMKRRKVDAKVLNGKYPGTYKVEYFIRDNPLVSIIIPFKDKSELLKMCIESILQKTTYENFEVIGISNNSEEKETFEEMRRLGSLDNRVKFYEYNIPFNYSDINNYAVKTYAKGEHIILLNNDIEIITSKWIEEMLMHSQRKEIGAVGAKLYYPNDTVQHAGVIIGIGGTAGHAHKYFNRKHTGYFARLNLIQNFSAVTAACLMIKKSLFYEVGGLNEKNLKIAFNDVDFCLRIQEKGYRNIFTPYCEAYHHESISRGSEDTQKKKERFRNEVLFMRKRHKKILEDGDPYYHKNLTLIKQNFQIKENEK
ncbi:MAG: glycosyltransferase [Campylobacteraceae bacterium]|nr:glycosyltransferase [Campylobacteraceae bacterium]